MLLEAPFLFLGISSFQLWPVPQAVYEDPHSGSAFALCCSLVHFLQTLSQTHPLCALSFWHVGHCSIWPPPPRVPLHVVRKSLQPRSSGERERLALPLKQAIKQLFSCPVNMVRVGSCCPPVPVSSRTICRLHH